MMRILTAMLFVGLGLAAMRPAEAQIYMGPGSAQRAQKAAEKEKKASIKAGRKQQKAMQKYEKQQRKAAKRQQRRR